nr:MAG TPA: Large Terminase [Caudoviricetes sp.]
MLTTDYLGYRLLQRGFRDWFLYMFRVLNKSGFTIEKIHEELFVCFQDILDGKLLRTCLNLPPRSAKTTLAKYFVIYTLTKNPKSQIIYTSFSQELLTQIATEIANIMQGSIYKALYPNTANSLNSETLDPVDSFWKDYLLKEKGVSSFSSKKIITSSGGLVLFASIGSAITGFGAGMRNSKEFSGALIIDDANKPADIRSLVLRTKVHNYFVETLFTRLNSSSVPVVNIQQRLHLEDLTGFLVDSYKFKTVKFPLINEKSECNLPSQYTKERIEELKKNEYVFASQYQQTPILEGGNLIKTAWFVKYETVPEKFDSLYIVADTAFTAKKSSDFSAFGLFGILGHKLYMLDGYYKKVIFPDLQRDLTSFYNKAKATYKNSPFSAIYIENKGSGISLIQSLRIRGLPVSELTPTVKNIQARKDQTADKYTRFLEVSSDLESGYFHIPSSALWLNDFITEVSSFTGTSADLHDDFTDVLIYALKVRRGRLSTDWTGFKNAFIKRV